MSFIEDHPHYKSYKIPSSLYFQDVPRSIWTELESIIAEAGGKDRTTLSVVVTNIARIVRAGNVDAGLAYHYIPDVVSVLRRKVKEGKFNLFMDSLAVLCDEGELSIDVINEFLDDNKIGYRACKSGWSNSIVWEKIEDIDLMKSDADENKVSESSEWNSVEKTTSKERLGKVYYEMEKNIKRDEIFISHRTVDETFADMILDYLSGCEIPRDKIFCSSLPGNDVDEKINSEVKEHLKKAAIMILILSNNYYESAFCLNESGVAWYLDEVASIPIGLPEISHKNMVGFFNQEYKLRRLDCDDDIAFIFDKVKEKLNVGTSKHGVITRETKKLKERYKQQIEKRDVKDISYNNVKDGDDFDFGDLDNSKSNNPVVQIIIDAGGSAQGIEYIVAMSGLAKTTVRRKLKEAIDKGEIETDGSGKNVVYKVVN